MKRFLVHSCLFIFILLASFFMVFSMADGATDAFYGKFSSPKQTSLIVGSSRAAQGILPNVIDSIYGSHDIYNYAFTISGTPYGRAYYNSIVSKLNGKSMNGVFIIGVNPLSLSEYKFNTKKKNIKYPEDDNFIAKTHFVNLKPNVEYLIESFNGKNVAIIRNTWRKGLNQTTFLHQNGWLEVTVESDSILKSKRTTKKVLDYRRRIPRFTGISEYRLEYLEKTINLFKDHGEVYLVRIPVIEGMLEVENEIAPDFDKRMDEVARINQIPYINIMPFNKDYDYTDGNHLTSNSAKQFSIDLAVKMDGLRKQL